MRDQLPGGFFNLRRLLPKNGLHETLCDSRLLFAGCRIRLIHGMAVADDLRS